jgi:hypothetical protein
MGAKPVRRYRYPAFLTCMSISSITQETILRDACGQRIPGHGAIGRFGTRLCLVLGLLLSLCAWCGAASADPKPVEIHDRLVNVQEESKRIALTLDACSGKFDDDLIEFLIRNKIPATQFATEKWLLANPLGVSVIKSHLDLFDVEDHGENHIPAVIGVGKKVYGIPGEPDVTLEQMQQAHGQAFRGVGGGFVHVGNDDVAIFYFFESRFNGRPTQRCAGVRID